MKDVARGIGGGVVISGGSNEAEAEGVAGVGPGAEGYLRMMCSVALATELRPRKEKGRKKRWI